MRIVNRFFGGTAAIKAFIRYAASKHPTGQPLRILDIGSGSCDIPMAVIKWARSKNIEVEFTCIERESRAFDHLADGSELPLRIVTADIFNYQPQTPFDYATASMFLHHLDNEQIGRLLKRLLTCTRKGIFINDLHRCALTYYSFGLISPFLPEEVRRDALVSIKKGFKKEDFNALLIGPGSIVTVRTRPWGRITAFLEFNERTTE